MQAAIQSERDRTEKLLAEAAERQRELEERTTKMVDTVRASGMSSAARQRASGSFELELPGSSGFARDVQRVREGTTRLVVARVGAEGIGLRRKM